MLMHQCAERFYLRLEHAVRAGIGDHDGRQVSAVRFALGLHIDHVHIALLVTRDHHHLHAHHLCAGRVGTVRRGRNQTDVAMALAFSCVVSANDQQACILTLAACIGLQTNACITRGLA